MVGLRRLELGSHVASTVNGTEGETSLVGFPVTGDLAFDLVDGPGGLGLPAEGGDPVLGANGRDSTISVTGVVEHPDVGALEVLVDPLGCLLLGIVDDTSLAKVPSLNVVGDVHGFTHLLLVHVVKKFGAKGARRELLKGLGVTVGRGGPWGVIGGGGDLLVRSGAIGVDHVGEATSSLGVGSRAPADTEDIVHVDIGG